jgi:hypothetical protein
LISHESAAFRVASEPSFQKIGKEKQFKDNKDYEEFYQNYDPDPFSQGRHTAETVIIEQEQVSEC